MYLEGVTPTKSEEVQRFDRRASRGLQRLLGSTCRPEQLSRTEWDRFIKERGSGKLTGKPVGPRTIARDLKLLLAVLNWATLSSDGRGGVLLDRNPLRGLPIPSEKNPNRPVLRSGEFTELLKASEEVHPMLRTLLIMANETGHRIGAIRRLRWSDLDFEAEVVLWRAENDKIGHEHVTPLTQVATAALKEHRTTTCVGGVFVFPAPRGVGKPISRHLVRDWWERAEALAGLERIDGRGWHSLRRKFATDLMAMPLKVLGQLGGWKGTDTIVECYQHADQSLLRTALQAHRGVPFSPEQRERTAGTA